MSKLTSLTSIIALTILLSACGVSNLPEDELEHNGSEQNDSADQNNQNDTGNDNVNNDDLDDEEGSDEENSEGDAKIRWTLIDERSHLNFVTTKKIHAVESHRFNTLEGIIDDTGLALFQIDLASVDTGVILRDQRMRDLFFDVANYPIAEASAEIPLADLEAMTSGERNLGEYAVTLSLHGMTQTLNVELSTLRLDSQTMLVQSQEPILIDALDFDFAEGLAELKQLARLDSISTAVPVDLFLVFSLSGQE